MKMRVACPKCESLVGYIEGHNGQNCVFCEQGHFCYNAPKTETGQKQRSVSTVHAGILPNRRSFVIERATGRCELCGATGNLHVSHILSVLDGLAYGLTELELNAPDNLCALCEECNLGMGKLSFSPRLYVALLQRRIRGGANE